MKHERLYELCESEIRAGRLKEAEARLRSIEPRTVPKSWRLRFAQLYRRLRLNSHGLRFMRSLIKPDRMSSINANPLEIAEYALLLERVGAINEALRWLEPLKDSLIPEVLFARISCAVAQWNYEEALPLIEKYERVVENPYSKAIAQTNLAACYAALNMHDKVIKTATSSINNCEKNEWHRLAANCHEIRAQAHIAKSDYASAREDLIRSLAIIGSGPTREPLHVLKWFKIIEAFEKKSVEPLEYFKKVAITQNDWFSIRDADLYRLLVKYDENIFNHLYFGSPQPGYRRHIEKELGKKPSAKTFYWGTTSGPVLDLTGENISGESRGLKPGQKVHRVLEILSRDFYAPCSVGHVFSNLHQGEYFDPDTSPKRVRQLIYRARKWIDENKLPLVIYENEGLYSLETVGQIRILVSMEREQPTEQSVFLHRLGLEFKDKEFTAVQARAVLELSYGKWHRFISAAIEDNKVAVVGSARTTRYRINGSK